MISHIGNIQRVIRALKVDKKKKLDDRKTLHTTSPYQHHFPQSFRRLLKGHIPDFACNSERRAPSATRS